MSRRYYLYLRSGVFHAKLIDPKSGIFLNARSTGKRDKDEALRVVAEWLNDGLEDTAGGRKKQIASVFAVEALVAAIRTAPKLDTADVKKILAALEERSCSQKNPNSSLSSCKPLRRGWACRSPCP